MRTHEIEYKSTVTSESTNHSPVRFVHPDFVAVLSLTVCAETPLESDDSENGEDESERSNEHRSGEASPRDESGVGFRSVGSGSGTGRVGRRDIPERSDEGSTEENEEETKSETV